MDEVEAEYKIILVNSDTESTEGKKVTYPND